MEWTVRQVSARAGVSSRTLRHYGDIGLLQPSRTGANGYRYYDAKALARLQRILLLRDLGLKLSEIARILDKSQDEEAALHDHLRLLEAERDRWERRISAVRHMLDARQRGEDPSERMMLEGFNDPYRKEVIAQWGERAFHDSNSWWHSKSLMERVEWKRQTDDLIEAWVRAWRDGVAPASPRAHDLAVRHVEWLAAVPGTPMADGDRSRSIDLVRSLGRLYVENPAFTRTYGGEDGAAFVRDCLEEHACRCM